MTEYVFVCIGTNNLIIDSFGPRVGEKLQRNLEGYPKIQIFGTMQKPVHFNNAPVLLNQLTQSQIEKTILIDSAIGKKGNIGDTYVNIGGMEIGKAYGKSLYFPAIINIKTIVAKQNKIPNWNNSQIDFLAEQVATQITKAIYQI